MTTAKYKESDKTLILANDFFDLVKTREDFSEWLYRRISDFDMEVNHDFYIFLDVEAAKELSGYETFKDKKDLEKIRRVLAK
jgi:phage anti-repressor protein